MSKEDPRDERDPNRSETDPELDIDEGADVFEERKDAIDGQRSDAAERQDEDVINLDPSD